VAPQWYFWASPPLSHPAAPGGQICLLAVATAAAAANKAKGLEKPHYSSEVFGVSDDLCIPARMLI